MAESKTPGEMILEAISGLLEEDFGALQAKIELVDTLARRIGETCDAVLAQNPKFASSSILISGLLQVLAEVIVTHSETKTPEHRVDLEEVRRGLCITRDALDRYVMVQVGAARAAGAVIVMSRPSKGKGSAEPAPPAPPAYDRDRDNPLPDVPENTFSGSRSSGTEG